jgi:type VI secretion system protein ImpL
MKWIVHILKSRLFLGSIGVVLLVGAVLLLGRWLEWELTTQLAGVIGVLLLTLIGLGVSFVRANRRAAHIEQSIRQQAEDQVLSTRPDKRGEIEELRQRLDRAIETLKQSKLGRGRWGQSALYALPWYMIIGPPGAGKTTAIANSGLNFPLGSQRVRGIGGTRNCDWFFSDSAILLDTAGRYMTEEQDTDEWRTFLEILKNNRSSQPINGVIVGISIAELAEATPEEIESHARNIRRRIDELVEILDVKFPVYLVFTKCDLLKGFVEFFGEQTRKEREQVWGSTLSYEQQDAENLRSIFETEFERLTEVLMNRRSARLQRSMKREERHAVYAFPLQFAAAKDNLSLFVDLLFQPNPYQENPTFRGFYFTSGTQEGVPIDQVIQNIARQFDLPVASGGGFDPEMETKSYFLKDLFTDVIIPDQFMVQRTSRAAHKNRLVQVGMATAAVVLVAGFVLATSLALSWSKASLHDTRDAVVQVDGLQWGGAGDIMDKLDRLERLSEQIDNLDEWSVLRLGLSRDGTIREPARKLYLQYVDGLVDTYFRRPVDNRLRAVMATGRTDNRGETIDHLKAYLLMSRETDQLAEEHNRNFLQGYLARIMVDTLEDRTEYERAELGRGVQPHLAAFVGALHEGGIEALEEDPALVARVCEVAYQPPSIPGIYDKIRLETSPRLEGESISLSEITPGSMSLFSTNPNVSGFYRKTAVDGVLGAIERESADPHRDDWVCRGTRDQRILEQWDSEEMAETLRKRYFEEYARAWEDFLNGVRVRSYGSISQAERALEELNAPNSSPLLRVLARVTDETMFIPGDEEEPGLVDRLRGLAGRSPEEDSARTAGTTHPVNSRFQWLHTLNPDRAESGGAPALSGSITPLGAVQQAVADIADNGGPAAAEFAGSVLQNNGGELGNQLQSIRTALPTGTSIGRAVREAFFEQPVLYAWEVIARETQNHFNRRWQELVYRPFHEKFAEFYPFDAGSGMSAPFNDVQRFFGPDDGPLLFFRNELRDFLGTNFEPRRWQGEGLRLSPAAQQALEKAQQIHEILFTGDVMQLTFDLRPELPDKGNHPTVDLYDLTIHGKSETYDMGHARWTTFSWPGSSAGTSLSISTREGNFTPKRYDGDWAWFRMLEDADIRRTAPAEYIVRWTFERPDQVRIVVPYHLSIQTARFPFENIRSFFTFQPPTTLD